MKNILGHLLLSVALTANLGCAQAQDAANENVPAAKGPLRVFIIGNSFSRNATRYLPELAKNGGHELILGRAEAPGRAMNQHWEAVEAAEANPEDPKGKLYDGKTLRTLLSEGQWDIVTIQQSSVYSSDIDTYRPHAQKLRDFIKTLQPKAEVVMHQTWSYRSDSKAFGFIHASKGERTQSAQEMWEKSRYAYRTVASELGLRVIPNGDAFWKAGQDATWGFKPDEKFDFAKAAPPVLPNQSNSLHAGYSWQGTTLNFDSNNHASDAGMYLGGLVWYGFLFGESPEKLSYVPTEVPADFAAYLRQVAAQTLKDDAHK